ncbi:hypothetical protein CEXT_94811 [Caerostris extrusa]|uniref:Uncharacterized protein n=1 Tax=Caerostris extrusa TaxID=172846 RepID=A0AAV4QY30_CAEEX|nr:hypothetical protein CEXT_94811 [Caerostris extrusa]
MPNLSQKLYFIKCTDEGSPLIGLNTLTKTNVTKGWKNASITEGEDISVTASTSGYFEDSDDVFFPYFDNDKCLTASIFILENISAIIGTKVNGVFFLSLPLPSRLHTSQIFRNSFPPCSILTNKNVSLACL